MASCGPSDSLKKFDFKNSFKKNTMDQNWTTVCRRRKPKITEFIYKHPKIDSPKICINPNSVQELIRTRIEKNLNQEKSAALCAFPRNTFKNIESHRIIPTEEQKLRIQKHFNVYLKMDIV